MQRRPPIATPLGGWVLAMEAVPGFSLHLLRPPATPTTRLSTRHLSTQPEEDASVTAQNMRLTALLRSGDTATACRLFDGMPRRTVVTWNAMVAGQARQGSVLDALDVATHMHHSGVSPNEATFASVLGACARGRHLRVGAQVHCQVLKSGSENFTVVGASLLDFYSSCFDLDLRDTLGLRDHHLDQIGQLRHLIYLSLRECTNIYCLPDSVGNLRHLQALDIRGTHIFELPTTIIKLGKLQHLHATGYWNAIGNVKGCDVICNVKKEDDIGFKYRKHWYRYMQAYIDRGDDIGCYSRLLYARRFLSRPQVLDSSLNRHDMLNLLRFSMMSIDETYSKYLRDPYFYYYSLDGVEVPRGIGKLKTLHTLSFFNVARGKGKTALKELGELTQLHKLGVAGINSQNSKEFWSVIAGHNQLQSLSVQGYRALTQLEKNSTGQMHWGVLDSYLCEGLSPPSCLRKLKLYGNLVRVTDWIHQLQNLSKLTLEHTRLERDDDIQALGVLPNLAVLRLKDKSYVGEELCFKGQSFPSLVMLDLEELRELNVSFEGDAMPKLELLQVNDCRQYISSLPDHINFRTHNRSDYPVDNWMDDLW